MYGGFNTRWGWPAGCARVCHEACAPLIVDEAHGAHLAFLRAKAGAPGPALAAGADVAVQSSHKTLSALGQARFAPGCSGLGPGCQRSYNSVAHVL